MMGRKCMVRIRLVSLMFVEFDQLSRRMLRRRRFSCSNSCGMSRLKSILQRQQRRLHALYTPSSLSPAPAREHCQDIHETSETRLSHLVVLDPWCARRNKGLASSVLVGRDAINRHPNGHKAAQPLRFQHQKLSRHNSLSLKLAKGHPSTARDKHFGRFRLQSSRCTRRLCFNAY